MPVRIGLTEGTVANCTQAHSLIAEIPAQYLLADRGYDTNATVAEAAVQAMQLVVPPRSHRKKPRYSDQALYQLRHLVEDSFLGSKQPRAVAARYAKNEASYLVICQIRAQAIWTRLFWRHPLGPQGGLAIISDSNKVLTSITDTSPETGATFRLDTSELSRKWLTTFNPRLVALI